MWEVNLSNSVMTPGVVAARLPPETYAENFADLHPPLTEHEASVAADRCYFCYDAPCIAACPTDIDIPLFIRQIASNVPDAAARTIFDSNILGGICARVCPTETLCEEACVRETSEGKPVEIGRLQRYATDSLMNKGTHPFTRGAPSGKTVAVVGSGPAGLACAHRLAMKGHEVTVFESSQKGGGLNEYGIAAYKTVDGFAGREVKWIQGIGGIRLETGAPPVDRDRLDRLRSEFDAVFLGIGLSGVNSLAVDGNESGNVNDAVDFIAEVRQADDLGSIPVGRNVVVIGGGMTAIDAAVQSRLLGVESVTLVYRRSRREMGASRYEQDLAASNGVSIVTNARPVRILGSGAAREVEFEYTRSDPDGLAGTGETFRVAADLVLRAIGQNLSDALPSLEIEKGKIKVAGAGRTSLEGVWAGGDCASGGQDLTVVAVAEGRDAAEDIHTMLSK